MLQITSTSGFCKHLFTNSSKCLFNPFNSSFTASEKLSDETDNSKKENNVDLSPPVSPPYNAALTPPPSPRGFSSGHLSPKRSMLPTSHSAPNIAALARAAAKAGKYNQRARTPQYVTCLYKLENKLPVQVSHFTCTWYQ